MPDQKDVLEYYGANIEAERLARGAGALEFARTKEILGRFLEPRSEIADVGGAVGHYAEWLADERHSVELLDVVPLHVDLARQRAGEPARFGARLGDARALPFDDGSFDAILLLGPLYHLGEARDRALALREAARVCRAGGIVFAAAISRLAPLLDNIRRNRFREALDNALEEATTGRRVPLSGGQRPSPTRTSTFRKSSRER